MRTARVALVLVLASVIGCDCGHAPNPGCTTSSQCSAGEVCTAGQCVAGIDAGDPDTGPRVDAWLCPSSRRCGVGCCDDGQVCEMNLCLSACETGLRCGPSHACCATGDLCISDACTTPGGECIEEIDCPEGSFCDPTLGRCLPRSATRCEYHPPPGVFTPEQQWSWTFSDVEPASVNVMMSPMVGDIDHDGIPEVAFYTYSAEESFNGHGVMRVVRGDTGAEVRNFTATAFCPEFGIALGDLEGDGEVEIIAGINDCVVGQIAAFHLDGTEVWRSHLPTGEPWTLRLELGAMSVADLEGDGRAEVVVGGSVLEANGELRWDRRSGAAANCCGALQRGAVSAISNVDADPELEVIAGNAVWNYDGSVLWEDATNANDGYVAVGDFFADDIVDIVVVHSGNVTIRRGNDGMRLWGPRPIPGGGRGGPPTVADFDGDHLPEIGVAGSTSYSVFDPDGPMPVRWSRVTQDDSSNVTGSSVFDFDGDGRAEVVYNDECYMRVYSGVDGTVLTQVANNSLTQIEYPVIVDVDGDGNTEIVFAANSALTNCGHIPDYPGLISGVRVFRDAADNWVGTRSVWNEHSYHITNVRSDLRIPAHEVPNVSRFNNFRQNPQSFEAPDLTATMLAADATLCPTSLTLRAEIHNEGAITVGPGLPVTFYAGSPSMPGRALVTVRTTSAIPPGGLTTVTATFTPMGTEVGAMGIPFFVRADDAGAGRGENNECIEDNNTAAATYDCGDVM